jgi:hypothetical protein
MKKLLLAAAAITLMMTTAVLTSCEKLEEWEGMNDGRAYYTYKAQSNDFDYRDGAGPFDMAIRNSVGLEPILGGNDEKVIEACNACYENLKQRLNGKSGMVVIIKTRHPDGKSKMLTAYAFQ